MISLWKPAFLLGLSSTLLVRLPEPFVPEAPQTAETTCVAFYDWKNHIRFWPDPKIHARQGPVPEGYPDDWEHVQTSLWEVSGHGLGEDEEVATDLVESWEAEEEGELVEKRVAFPADRIDLPSSGNRLRHLAFEDGYAVNHETTPCFSPGGPGQGPS